ncbi:hypothetical protein J5N97_019741 [Dioscorea zingiberensis]|uniref:Uncharacterized protein n=1 Tax=Dioscorea zingiberensis TaxID=325984 RepID=A0A9D5CEF0_9LILI|nr:hypothetical protein J5N97_019741 [Dioscorea zingiberensis]
MAILPLPLRPNFVDLAVVVLLGLGEKAHEYRTWESERACESEAASLELYPSSSSPPPIHPPQPPPSPPTAPRATTKEGISLFSFPSFDLNPGAAIVVRRFLQKRLSKTSSPESSYFLKKQA